jgi:hypothetical protein
MRIVYVPVILLLFLFSHPGSTQSINGDESVTSTQATNPKARPDAKKQGKKKKKKRYIIRSETQGTLIGNKCFEEVTEKFGFEYLIVPENMPPKPKKFSRSLHNFGIKTVLFFKNGPGWQIRLKKKYKQCRYQYGDYVG